MVQIEEMANCLYPVELFSGIRLGLQPPQRLVEKASQERIRERAQPLPLRVRLPRKLQVPKLVEPLAPLRQGRHDGEVAIPEKEAGKLLLQNDLGPRYLVGPAPAVFFGH